ncbi:hypothetical protein [Streptomyces sp. NPDC002088]|uniref:hypothetical protein n=1 Tax=Streptomyces sp. NPDC002088 TaxID=3154665 RepID=UPI00331939DF
MSPLYAVPGASVVPPSATTETRGPHRLTELRVPLPAVTPKVLSETLRANERSA